MAKPNLNPEDKAYHWCGPYTLTYQGTEQGGEGWGVGLGRKMEDQEETPP